MDNTIVISTPPHVKSHRTTKNIMLDVVISLIPAAICGIIFFLLDALIIELTAVIFAVLGEFAYYFIQNNGFDWHFTSNEIKSLQNEIKTLKANNAEKALIDEKEKQLKELKKAAQNSSFAVSKNVCKKFIKQFDYTSVVTGLILALILPSTAHWYEVAIGSIFAIVIVKMLFGGTGKNIANPAACGRVFMFISFSLTTFAAASIACVAGETLSTGATYLSGYLIDGNSSAVSLVDLFLGTGLAGCIGETCKLALILGYIYLVVRKVIKWWQPLIYIVVAALCSVMFNGFDFALFLPYALSGGLMFGAIFMATDYVTSPKGVYAQITYYIALGVLTALLRKLTGLEVVSFVILIMNLITPLLDRYIIRKPFGYVKEKKAKKEAK